MVPLGVFFHYSILDHPKGHFTLRATYYSGILKGVFYHYSFLDHPKGDFTPRAAYYSGTLRGYFITTHLDYPKGGLLQWYP
jgi:hypothetical protein